MIKNSLGRRTFFRFGLRATAAALLAPYIGRHTAQAAPDRFVDFRLSGAIAPTSATVVAKLNRDSPAVRLVTSTQPDLTNPVFSPPQTADIDANRRLLRFSPTGLQPDTQYYYSFESEGITDSEIGRFRTTAAGPYSFTFALSCCARTGSDDPAFAAIRALDPLFFLHMGDLHYVNPSVNNPDYFRNAFDFVFTSPEQYDLYRDVPLTYMYDDHDYGDNNSDKFSPSREAARTVYQEYIPHHPLAAGSGNVPVYQTFTIGRVRFILTDTRSERDSESLPRDAPDKTMLGETQKAWLKQQLLNGRDEAALTIWMCTSPWLADPPGSSADNWSGFTAERRELSDFIVNNGITNLLYISGDVHMLGFDDGSNNRYSSSGAAAFPIFQAGAIDQSGSFFVSNTYSAGQFPGRNQYGVITIDDDGNTLTVTLSGRNVFQGELIRQSLTFSPSLPQKLYIPVVSR